MIRSGVELRRQGRNAEALRKFESAYNLSRSARAAAQLGLCEQALERWEAAEQHLSEALLGESDPWLARNRKTVEASRGEVRKHLAAIEIQVQPAEAIVNVNDVAMGLASEVQTIWLSEGEVVVSAVLSGYQTKTSTQRAKAGEKTQFKLSLSKFADLPSATPAGSSIATTDSVAISPNVEEQRTAPDAQRTANWRPYVGWASVGLSAVSLGVGVLGYLARQSAARKFNDEERAPPCGVGPGDTIVGGDVCTRLNEDVSRGTTQTIVGLVGAAVFGGVGAFLLTGRPDHAESDAGFPRAMARCQPDAGLASSSLGLGFSCAGIF